jgi:ubiquinone/menaquinone biosynthesis C-methylase UbiE
MNDIHSVNMPDVFNPKNPPPAICLTKQIWATLLYKTIGGPLTYLPGQEQITNVLDIACTYGDWAVDVAIERPTMNITGIDADPTTISYATAKACTLKAANITFRNMDYLAPLKFRDATFDLVHGTLLSFHIPTAGWPTFLNECFRVLRPGGMIYLVDSGGSVSNSVTWNFFNTICYQNLYDAGFGFSTDGNTAIINAFLSNIFHQTGFQEVTNRFHTIDFSSDAEAWSNSYHCIDILTQHVQQSPCISERDRPMIQQQSQQMLLDMLSKDFYGTWPFLQIWAKKPPQNHA